MGKAKRYLKISEVRDIHRRFYAFEDAREIAASLGISPTTVYKIGRGETYGDLTGQRRKIGRAGCTRQRLRLPENLLELYENHSIRILALEFGVGWQTVKRELIRRGATIRGIEHPVTVRLTNAHKRGLLRIYHEGRWPLLNV